MQLVEDVKLHTITAAIDRSDKSSIDYQAFRSCLIAVPAYSLDLYIFMPEALHHPQLRIITEYKFLLLSFIYLALTTGPITRRKKNIDKRAPTVDIHHL